ncbi:MAG: anaerobic ribonucleoside-triphosphate reductase activating protein [Bacteroidales bacterium]
MSVNYASIINNDIINGDEGISVSFWTQGCPHRCKGCHNPETFDHEGGKIAPPLLEEDICNRISADGILRNLSILGGEPLWGENLFLVHRIVATVRERFKNTIKIYLWTGYTLEYLLIKENPFIEFILENIDVLVDGPYVESLRDTSLLLRGSSNQRIFRKEDGSFIMKKPF